MGLLGVSSFFDPVFDPASESDREKVRKDLEAFMKADAALMSRDRFLVPAAAIDLFCLCSAFFTSASNIAFLFSAVYPLLGAAGIYGMSEVMQRPSVLKDRHDKLDQLIKTYRYMTKGQSAAITKESFFMDVAEAIAPYVQTKLLTPWPVSAEPPQNFSMRYRRLMSGPLHYLEIPLPAPGYGETFYKKVRDQLPSYVVTPAQAEAGQSAEPEIVDSTNLLSKAGLLAGRVKSSGPYANTIRMMYGYKDPEEVKAPEPMRMTR